MESAEKFELRVVDKVWATLTFESDGRIVLEHNLTEDQVSRCPEVVLYDGAGQIVTGACGDIGNSQTGLLLYWPDGRIRHKLRLDDVVDSRNQVRLEWKSTGTGPGSVGEQPVQVVGIAGIVFSLRWIMPAP